MANRFVASAKRVAKTTFDGEEGSIFWLFKVMYRGFMRLVDAVNDWLYIRHTERMRREEERLDAIDNNDQ